MFDDISAERMFSQDSYEVIMALLNSDYSCQVDGLAMLSNTLIYGDHETLRDFPVGDVAMKLTELLVTCPQNDIKELATQCMNSFLEAHPGSTRALSEAGALEAVGQALTEFATEKIGHNCVHILKTVSEFRPGDLARKVGIRPLITQMGKLKIVEKRSASQALLGTTTEFTPSFLSDIEPLIGLCRDEDPTVRSNCLNSLAQILKQADKDQLDLSVLDGVVGLVNELEDGATMLEMMRALMNMSRNVKFANAMLPTKIDFDRVFFRLNFRGNTDEIRRAALNIIINLLPDVDLPDGYWILNNRTLDKSEEFAREIQPFALRMLLEKSGRENLVLAVVAASLLVQQIEPSEELLSVLGGLVQSPGCAPFVLLVVKSFKDVSVFFRLGFIALFKKVQVEDKIKEWYEDRLAKLIERGGKDAVTDPSEQVSVSSLDELCAFVLANELTPFRFQLSGLLKRATELIREADTVSPALFPAIEKIIRLSHGILLFLPVSKLSDPFWSMTPNEILSKSVKATLKFKDEEKSGITISVDLDFSGLEAWYNSQKKTVTTEMMLQVLAESEFKDVLVIKNPENLFHTQLGLIRRNLDIPSNIKYHFRINDKEFSAHDCLFHAIARSIKDPEDFQKTHVIEYIEGDSQRAPIVVPCDIPEGLLETMRLLESIHQKVPTLAVRSELFQKHIFLQLQSPVLTMGFFSPASRIIYHFPFMFDFGMRQAFFRIIGFDLSYSLPYMNNYFFKAPWNQRTNSMRITCCVRRDHIFEDGMKLLKIAGPGLLRIDVMYKGEEGIGAGPTQEFFLLFSRELLKKDKHIWRNSCVDASNEYVVSKNGLFPAPNADPKLFYLIGLLVGKALLMDMIVHLSFNPAFCKLMLGRKITLAEVDPELAKSLSRTKPEDLAGLTFTYPGYPDVELKPGGADIEIIPENFEEYKALVEKKTVEIPEIINEFRSALSTIVSWETLNVFSPEEISHLIAGEEASVTREELESYVEVSHGYDRSSPQIGMLFDIIVEMTNAERSALFKFITGSDRLPVGGLKALNPTLTIALRTPEQGSPDDCLPSVMTCANYFKIPQYTTREIMKEKIAMAIGEGQESFMLT